MALAENLTGWYRSFNAKQEMRRARDRQEAEEVRKRRRSEQREGTGEMCEHCNMRHVATGESKTQRYARRLKLCASCYQEGWRT